MSCLRGEFVYTCTGRQRPVFLRAEGGAARFVLSTGSRDMARVEVTYDGREDVRKGQACWEAFEPEGGVYGACALRVVIDRVDGWVVLALEQDD